MLGIAKNIFSDFNVMLLECIDQHQHLVLWNIHFFKISKDIRHIQCKSSIGPQ